MIPKVKIRINSCMKGLMMLQVRDTGDVALTPKSIMPVGQREREGASMNFNLYVYHFCQSFLIVLERELKVSMI